MKQIIWVMTVLALVGFAVAEEVCVVVEFPDKIESECLDVDEEISGYELLEESGFNAFWNEYPGFGYMLCKIDGVGTDSAVGGGCEYTGEYWAFYIADDEGLEYSLVGLSSYEVNDGDLLVLSYGDGTTTPVMLQVDNLKTYVDGDKDKSVDETSVGTTESNDIEFESITPFLGVFSLILLLLLVVVLLIFGFIRKMEL